MMWFDPGTNTIIHDSEQCARIMGTIFGAKYLGGNLTACEATLYNLQMLRWLGLDVIPPMRDGTYDWPIRPGRRPRDHQKAMANFMVLNPRSFNLSDMGTMKTQSALWAADFIMREHERAGLRCRAIINTTVSTMQRTWGDAIFHDFMGRRKYAVLHGDAKKRERLLGEDVDFYIINYDGLGVGASMQKKLELGGFSKQLAERADIRIALTDEASAYRDGSTKRHRVARQVLKHRPYFWLMTGTPTPNGPTDAHGLARLVNDAHGESFTSFKRRTMLQLSQFKWVPAKGSHNEAHRLMQPAIRYAIEDCWDLPECTTTQRDVELTADQKKALKTFKDQAVLATDKGGTITAANEAVLRMKLMQISAGAIYDADHKVHYINAAPRLEECRAAVEESARKTIIFAPLTSVLHLLYNHFTDYTREIINGDVKLKQRDEIFRRFQQEDTPQLLIADPATMAHGLDLYAATTIIWYVPTDKTEVYLQANKRIDRPGQTHPTSIVQLASTPTEREIYRRLENNESMQGVILSMVRGEG